MSAVTTAIQNYRSGSTTWDDLLRFITTRKWPQPERYKDLPEDPFAREFELDNRSPYTDGTWDEVLRARNYGLLTNSEYDALNRAVLQTALD